MSDRMKAQLRHAGFDAEAASIINDMVGHGVGVAMEAIKRHVQVAPEALQPVILRGVIGSLIIGWRDMTPETVEQAMKVSMADAEKGIVLVVKGEG